MGRDFAIVPVKSIKVDTAYSVIESVMKVERIDVSKKNRIAIGIDKNIIFDIGTEIIKGKILDPEGKIEKSIVKKIIGLLGNEKVYLHFYGQDNFLKEENKIKII